MANKPIKRCATPLATTEIKINTTVKCHYTHLRTVKEDVTVPNAGEDAE